MLLGITVESKALYSREKDTFTRADQRREKLAVTLRFLATGESYQSLMYQFRIHQSTISLFVPKVCQVIYDVLCEDYFNMPSSEEDWLNLANGTQERWQFPNAFAAADGKHIAINHPYGSGSEFYNYKGFYSIVLLAYVDYDYKFIYADVGCQGRISDGGVYRNSTFFSKLSKGELNLPPSKALPTSNNPEWLPFQTNEEVPFVFVADNAFPLTEHCMKPYPDKGLTDQKRIFNYRLSRFRRVTENAFGIMTSVFRIFSTSRPINLHPDKVTSIVMAAIVLHNMLREKSADSYTPQGFADEVVNDNVIEGRWRTEQEVSILEPLPARQSANRAKKSAERLRDIFAEHFYGSGQVPWQWKCLI